MKPALGPMLAASWVSTAAVVLVLATGCSTDPCPDPVQADACDVTHCGPPTVEVGNGATSHEPVSDGDTVQTIWGPQGGYHVDYSVRVDGYCPILWVRSSLDVIDANGERIELSFQEQHVQAVPVDANDSLLDYWGVTAFVPCDWWPNDPINDPEPPPECTGGVGLTGRIDEHRIVMRIEVEDHDGRITAAEREVEVDCCP